MFVQLVFNILNLLLNRFTAWQPTYCLFSVLIRQRKSQVLARELFERGRRHNDLLHGIKLHLLLLLWLLLLDPKQVASISIWISCAPIWRWVAHIRISGSSSVSEESGTTLIWRECII